MDNEGVKEIADLAKQAGGRVEFINVPWQDEAVPLAFVPNGVDGVFVQSIKAKLDEYRDTPLRRRGTASALTLRSFVDLVNRHKDDGSVVFADLLDKKPSLTAVLDYHALDNAPRNLEHRVRYVFPLSEEWQAWSSSNRKPMSQVAWAEFIENHMRDLVAPTDQETTDGKLYFEQQPAIPTRIISLSRGLEILVEAKVKEVRNLQSGEVELAFEETHKDAGGKTLKIPGLFVISIPLFMDGQKMRFLVRLRYRKSEGALFWFYDLVQPELVMREALCNDLDDVKKSTGLPTIEGRPEGSPTV